MFCGESDAERVSGDECDAGCDVLGVEVMLQVLLKMKVMLGVMFLVKVMLKVFPGMEMMSDVMFVVKMMLEVLFFEWVLEVIL